jgi:hypothetical protein
MYLSLNIQRLVLSSVRICTDQFARTMQLYKIYDIVLDGSGLSVLCGV